jgi:putative transposase
MPVNAMTYYERNLPHWHPTGKDVFITWRLFGSLPPELAKRIAAKSAENSGRQFRLVDAELDRGRRGPLWLKEDRVARVVMNSFVRGDSELHCFELHAFVVMANHVHLLVTPKVSVARITKGIKGAAGRKANAILGRAGMRFWQDESFDHWVRSAPEFERIKNYIEMNPVKAGLVKKPEDWEWSSAKGTGIVGKR